MIQHDKWSGELILIPSEYFQIILYEITLGNVNSGRLNRVISTHFRISGDALFPWPNDYLGY